MEIKSFNEWVLENPGKNINDYYAIYGRAASTPAPGNLHAHFTTHDPIPYNKPMNTTLNIRIAPWRLFVYTGIVIGSAIMWVLIFTFFPIILFGGHILRDIITKLFGG